MEKIHLHTSEFKLKFLGYGEWVEEPDIVRFQYKGYDCEVIRILMKEPFAKQEHWFGGFLCGYVFLNKEDEYFEKHYDEMNIDCHFGLTYSEYDDNEKYKIGFDCAHHCDYVPSTEKYTRELKIDGELMTLEKFNTCLMTLEKFKTSLLFDRVYKNIEFCIKQCHSIVDQLIEMKNKVRK